MTQEQKKLPAKAIITAELPHVRANFTRPNLRCDFYLTKSLTVLVLDTEALIVNL